MERSEEEQMNVLMVGVGPKRVGGMWTVAEQYINSREFNDKVNLTYIATSTNGSMLTRFLYMVLGYIKILWVLNTRPIDIVHIHMAEKGSTFRKGRVAKWARNKNKKVIIHLHAGPFMAWYKTVQKDKQETIKGIFHYADRVFVLGEYWKRELTEIMPDKKMVVVYNGVNCPEENAYNINAKNIVYFGVMRREKGVYDLINAIKMINDQLSKETKVILCGNDLEGDILEVIEKAGLKERFKLPGWVSGKEKEEIYHNAMIDVLPSYYEGLSMTVLEAMALGIPVITTDISTMPEVLGENGILVNPGDYKDLSKAIMSLLNSDNLRMTASKEEFNRATKMFSKEIFINKTLAQYTSLLNAR